MHKHEDVDAMYAGKYSLHFMLLHIDMLMWRQSLVLILSRPVFTIAKETMQL